jgi:transposase
VAVLRPARDHAQKKTRHASEQERPDVLSRRQAWFEGQPDLDPERLVFIDETWASTNMARTHGRCRRGERLRASVPHGHWKTTTFVAGLRTSGMVAPFVLDGPINADAFEVYVEKILVPELKPGDIVVMDNLKVHHSKILKPHFDERHFMAKCLPPQSCALNPIEQVWNIIKCEWVGSTPSNLTDRTRSGDLRGNRELWISEKANLGTLFRDLHDTPRE